MLAIIIILCAIRYIKKKNMNSDSISDKKLTDNLYSKDFENINPDFM